MKSKLLVLFWRIILTPLILLLPMPLQSAQVPNAELTGLWGAEKSFGPAVPFNLTIHIHPNNKTKINAKTKIKDGYAYVLGQRVPITTVQQGGKVALSFHLPGELGSFEGSMNQSANRIEGHWTSHPKKVLYANYATPVILLTTDKNTWTGTVHPVAERFSLYFLIEEAESGDLKVRLRNPDRNQGVFTRVASIKVEGSTLQFNSPDDDTLLLGSFDPDAGHITLEFPNRGGIYELTRRSRDNAPGYYPAPEDTRYQYRTPLNTGDGWATAPADTVGMSTADLQSLVQSILDTKTDSLITPYIHSVLVARQGKLVLEEYFYGYHADRVHDLRSASKTITALLAGQAFDAVAGFDSGSPVYQQFTKPIPQDESTPHRSALRASHLLSMSSGFDCDDNNDNSPGNENTMQEQAAELDWWEYTLALPMTAKPGSQGSYCSGGINLLGGLISKVQDTSLQTLFFQGLAEPLSISRYHMNLDPMGRGYAGGGLRMRPRDFLKIGQVLANQGRWQDTQIVSAEWIEQMLQSHTSIYADGDYGYGIWTGTLPYRGESIPVYSATGNGGQLLIVIPSLEMVVGFTGGNYGDFRTWIQWREQLVPDFILPGTK